MEELSETEPGDEEEVKEEKKLFYLGMDYPAEDEESEEEEETKSELLKSVVLNREESVESDPLLSAEDSSESTESLAGPTCGSSLLYMPQFRTVQCTRQIHDSKSQL